MYKYYINFNLSAKVDYQIIISLYKKADYNKKDKLYNTINYNSVNELAQRLELSTSTTNRILNNKEYNSFFTVDKKNKQIILNNNTSTLGCFVVLTDEEERILDDRKDNLLYKYYLYLKHFCITDKKQDFTAKQFLSYIGYSTKSNSMLDKICFYNKYLTQKDLLTITKYRDNNGRIRNSYELKIKNTGKKNKEETE